MTTLTLTAAPALVLDNSSLQVGEDVVQKEAIIERLDLDSLLLGSGLYWEEGTGAVYEHGGLIYLGTEHRNESRVISLLIHEFIHMLQYEYKVLLAHIEGNEVVIPDIGYRCEKAGWEEYLIDMGYLDPELSTYESIEEVLAMEMPAFLLQDSYNWFIRWYEWWKESLEYDED